MSENKGQYKKGQSGNPRGRPPLTEEMRRIKKLTRKQFEEFSSLLVTNDYSEIQKIVHEAAQGIGAHTALEVMMASSILKMAKRSDFNAVDKLLNRLIGSVQTNVKMSNDPENPVQMPQVVVTLPSNGREAKE